MEYRRCGRWYFYRSGHLFIFICQISQTRGLMELETAACRCCLQLREKLKPDPGRRLPTPPSHEGSEALRPGCAPSAPWHGAPDNPSPRRSSPGASAPVPQPGRPFRSSPLSGPGRQPAASLLVRRIPLCPLLPSPRVHGRRFCPLVPYSLAHKRQPHPPARLLPLSAAAPAPRRPPHGRLPA